LCQAAEIYRFKTLNWKKSGHIGRAGSSPALGTIKYERDFLLVSFLLRWNFPAGNKFSIAYKCLKQAVFSTTIDFLSKMCYYS